MTRWLFVVIAALIVVAGCGNDDDQSSPPAAEETSERAVEIVASEVPSGHAVDIAERWGKAWESGESDAVRALYSPDVIAMSGSMIDLVQRAVWTDVDEAIETINSTQDFKRFELVRVEEFLPYESQRSPSGFVVAEYEVDLNFAPEDPSDMDTVTVVAVFSSFDGDGLIAESHVYLQAWSSFFTNEIGGYPDREPEGAWIIVG